LAGKVEEKTTWNTKHGWVDNNKIYLKKIGWEVVDWINLAQDMKKWQVFVNTIINQVR
jgi:hypothetical protein